MAGTIRSAVFLVFLLSCKSSGGQDNTTNPNALHAHESWCPEGFETGPSDTCFAIPANPSKEAPVLVYLHGIYSGRGAPPEAALVRTATQRGFAVVLPRGKRGHCPLKAEVKDSFCWPEEPDDPVGMKSVVAEWDRVLWQVDALLEGGKHRRYVLGVGNGASFAVHLATRGFFDGEAFAIVDGVALAPVLPPRGKTSMLVMSAESNVKTKELSDALVKAGWKEAFCPRAGAELKAEDVDAALRFFDHEMKGASKPFPCEK